MKNFYTFLLLLVLCISAIGQTPVMTLTSSKAVGSSISLVLKCIANATPVQIDFGDGNPISYSIGTSDINITKELAGSRTISIYGAGIVYLTCSDCSLTALNVSENATLTKLNCNTNQLTALDITKNKALTFVDCSYNKLSVLDVTQNTALEFLICTMNNLGALDVSKNIALINLTCPNNNLTALDVSNNPNLGALDFKNNLLSKVDISKNSKIISYNCQNNKFTFKSIPIKQAGWLYYYYAPQQPVTIDKNVSIGTIIDLSDQFSINGTISGYIWKTKGGKTLVNGTDYSISGGKTTFLKAQLDSVYCEMTNATFPDFTGDKVLKTTCAGFQKITMTTSYAVGTNIVFYLGVTTSNTKIWVDFGDGNLIPYTISTSAQILGPLVKSQTVCIYGTDISFLDCRECKLTALDVSRAVKLYDLMCSNNQLTTLDVSKNTALNRIYCGGNQLTTLDVTNNAALDNLQCENNQLSELDLTKNLKLTMLICHTNKIKALDLSQHKLLQYISCENNKLKMLDVSKNTALGDLDCGENELTALDLSNNTKLENLYCEDNQLSTLRVSNNSPFNYFVCRYNQLNFSTLPIPQASWIHYVYNYQKPVAIAKSQAQGAALDLSSQLTINGKTTNYKWKTKKGTTLAEGTDYTLTGGKTVFLKAQDDSVYCEMTNATFPDFIAGNELKTTYTKILKAAQIITFTTLPAKKANDAPFNVSASASSALPVTFASSDPSVASITGTTVTILKAGNVTITATQEGNETWEPATASQTLNISKAGQTITFNALADKKANDAPFDLAASASSSQPVTFTSSDPSVASINGNKVTILKAGTVNITATQTGNAIWNAASASQTLTINKANQTISFNALAEKFANAAPFSLTATSNSGLAVSFTSSDPSIASVSGNTVTVKKSGSVTITASQTGDYNWNEASSVAQTLTILKATQTITFNALPAKNVKDASFELSASASSSLSVTFTSSDPTVVSISGNKVTILKVGTISITATQAGNDIWEVATISQSLVINEKQTQTITFNALPDKKVTDASFELSATTSSALPVTYTSSDLSVASISGSAVTIHKAGTTTITATQAGNDTWNPATAEQSLTITSVTGIGEEKENMLSVYPNPAADILYINGEISENTAVSIFSYIGSEVWSGIVKHQNINISHLPAGMYILKISNKDKQVRIIRFVKH
jgi:uncharacterized protein YjdB